MSAGSSTGQQEVLLVTAPRVHLVLSYTCVMHKATCPTITSEALNSSKGYVSAHAGGQQTWHPFRPKACFHSLQRHFLIRVHNSLVSIVAQ